MRKAVVIVFAIVTLAAFRQIATAMQETVDLSLMTGPSKTVVRAELASDTTCFFPSPLINGIEAGFGGITFDSHYYWVTVETANFPLGQIPPGKIMKLDPTSFEVLEEFNHESTAPTGITYNRDEDVFVTNAPLGGPPESPWDAGTDFFFVHDPQTLEVTETYTAPAGINSVFYASPTMTYFSVEVVNGTLSEHRRDDFSIINSYQLPGAPHHPKGLTMIPNPDGGPPYILVTYYPEPSEGVPGPGPDESGWMLQTLQIVDNQLLLLQTLRAIDGHIFGSGLTWVEQKQMLVTVGAPWLQQGHLGQVGTYLHDNFTGCYLLHGIPPWYVYTYLPIVLRSIPY